MTSKEILMSEYNRPYPSKWVRYEYDGNFYRRITFNQGLVEQMIKITGEPSAPLIITEIKKGESIRKSEMAKGNPGAICFINFERIDRDLREVQQQDSRNLGQEWYEDEFCKILKKNIFQSLKFWADYVLETNPNKKFAEAIASKIKLKIFFITKRDSLVSIKDRC